LRYGLSITVEPPNIEVVNFLDVTMNLKTSTCCPYRGPNDTTKCVDVLSNHPPAVMEGIPKSIEKGLSRISSSEGEFGKTRDVYQRALEDGGCTHALECQKPEPKDQQKQNKKNKKKKKEDILWFNPPFNLAVKTKIGKRFLDLLDTHFPKGHKLHKLLNRQTVKISYCCTKNIRTTIQNHNAKVLNSVEPRTKLKRCSC